MNKFLNILSLVGSFLIVFGVLFWLQDQTIGRLSILQDLNVFCFIQLKDLLFTATSLILILKFVSFYTPQRNHQE